jgi:hypothetical protein
MYMIADIGTTKRNVMKRTSNFRIWVQNIWFENRREHEEYHELPYTLEEYWQRYKYWLKREYQHTVKRNA